MKTAISIDAGLLRSSDDSARSMGVSRSRLFSLALDDFLQRRKQAQMLQRLNEVYADVDPSEKGLLKAMKTRTARTIKDKW
jgi:metal-responsive CopG/Arc/MetJ family transcriptional regulator